MRCATLYVLPLVKNDSLSFGHFTNQHNCMNVFVRNCRSLLILYITTGHHSRWSTASCTMATVLHLRFPEFPLCWRRRAAPAFVDIPHLLPPRQTPLQLLQAYRTYPFHFNSLTAQTLHEDISTYIISISINCHKPTEDVLSPRCLGSTPEPTQRNGTLDLPPHHHHILSANVTLAPSFKPFLSHTLP